MAADGSPCSGSVVAGQHVRCSVCGEPSRLRREKPGFAHDDLVSVYKRDIIHWDNSERD